MDPKAIGCKLALVIKWPKLQGFNIEFCLEKVLHEPPFLLLEQFELSSVKTNGIGLLKRGIFYQIWDNFGRMDACTLEDPWVHTFQPLAARFVCKVLAEVMPMILFPAVRQPGPQGLEDRNELFVLQHGYSKYIYVPKTNVYWIKRRLTFLLQTFQICIWVHTLNFI